MIDLALQAGARTAPFTWGVLDRLLEERWLKIEAISGTSAGAMNAAVLVSGHMQGGAEGREGGARRLLGSGGGSGQVQPDPALAARPVDEPLVARHVPGLSRDGY